MGISTAIFGAGCFWGIEAAFRKVEGVTGTEVGYSGGNIENPTYRDVCSGTTGHAEVVRVTFDPARVTYDELLDAFWAIHDPTQVDRQGPDVGTQYRTAIYFLDATQETQARAEGALRGRHGADVPTMSRRRKERGSPPQSSARYLTSLAFFKAPAVFPVTPTP